MKRLFVLLLFCAATLSLRAQPSSLMNGVLRDTLGRITNSIQLNADRYGNLLIAPDGVVWYRLTNALSVTNFTSGAPFYDLLTFTNISDGVRTPELISLLALNADGYPVDFVWQPFYSPPTNGTYAAGTVITNWGNDKSFIIPAFNQTMATNTYGFTWRTNANIVALDCQPISQSVPVSGTNLQFLLISKGSYTFTNGITWLFGFRK